MMVVLPGGLLKGLCVAGCLVLTAALVPLTEWLPTRQPLVFRVCSVLRHSCMAMLQHEHHHATNCHAVIVLEGAVG